MRSAAILASVSPVMLVVVSGPFRSHERPVKAIEKTAHPSGAERSFCSLCLRFALEFLPIVWSRYTLCNTFAFGIQILTNYGIVAHLIAGGALGGGSILRSRRHAGEHQPGA